LPSNAAKAFLRETSSISQLTAAHVVGFVVVFAFDVSVFASFLALRVAFFSCVQRRCVGRR